MEGEGEGERERERERERDRERERERERERGSLSSASESTGSKLHYEPHLFSVARSKTELFFGENLGEQKNSRSPKS